MAVNRADLAVFGVRGVEITRRKNFHVVEKTAQQFFRLACLGHQLHCLTLLVWRHLYVSLGRSQLTVPGQFHDGLDPNGVIGQRGDEPPPSRVARRPLTSCSPGDIIDQLAQGVG